MKAIVRASAVAVVVASAVIVWIQVGTHPTEGQDYIDAPRESPFVSAVASAYEDPTEGPPSDGGIGEPSGGPSPDVAILGDEYCQVETAAALNLLKSQARPNYDLVLRHIGVIECADAGTGIFVWEDPPRYRAGAATVQAGRTWYAGTIAHEACHAIQYQDYAQAHPTEEVPPEAFSGELAEAECLGTQKDALTQIGAGEEALETVRNALSTRYWEVEYEERWW